VNDPEKYRWSFSFQQDIGSSSDDNTPGDYLLDSSGEESLERTYFLGKQLVALEV